jgi:hypothetical protein
MSKAQIYNTLIDGENPLSNYIPELIKPLGLSNKENKHADQSINGILYLTTHIDDSYFKHREFDGCLNFSQKTLYKVLGQANYRDNICENKDHLFNKLFIKTHNGNSIDGCGNSAYVKSDYFQKAYSDWMVANRNMPVKLIDIKLPLTKSDDDNAEIVSSHVFVNVDAIKERLHEKNKEFKDFRDFIAPYEKQRLYINEEHNESMHIIKAIEHNLPYAYSLIKEINALTHNLAKLDDNKLVLKYKISDSGRSYGYGKFHLQSIKKDVREFLLRDYHSYDVESAAPVILSQVYARITGKEVPKSIQYYIDNKSAFRVALALFLKKDIDTAKSIFTMLFFGSKARKYVHPEMAIVKLLGKKRYRRLLKNRYFIPLVRDVEMMFKVIGDYYKEHHSVRVGKKWIIKNDKGREIVLDKWDNGKVVAHVYQGIESTILDTCIDYYKSKHDDASYLLIHDGFYALHELDTDDLEKCIFNETGFRIDYKPRQETLSKVQVLKIFNVCDIAVSMCEAIQKEKMAS